MINTVVVGHGLAGRAFHCPLIKRQPGSAPARDRGPRPRDPRRKPWRSGARTCAAIADLDDALADPAVELVVIATPHDSHADLAVRPSDAGKHCVVDKVMALTTADADRMIAARDRSGRMLSVFHNRRWDWDYLTVKELLAAGHDRPAALDRELGLPLRAAARLARARPMRPGRSCTTGARTWSTRPFSSAWAHAAALTAWLTPAPWEGVDSGGHGRIVLEFDDVLFQVESSRICRLDRPRWWIIGTEGGFVKYGIDPQEDALRAGDIDRAAEAARTRRPRSAGPAATARPSKPASRPCAATGTATTAISPNTSQGTSPLAVTAEQAREVVRLLEAAVQSADTHAIVAGPWGHS